MPPAGLEFELEAGSAGTEASGGLEVELEAGSAGTEASGGLELELEAGSSGTEASGGEERELGDGRELDTLSVVFHFCCFDSSSCFIAKSLRRFIASAFATFPIPLAASRSLRSQAANALRSRFESSEGGGSVSEVATLEPGTVLEDEEGEASGLVGAASGFCGSVDGSPVLRFFGPFLKGGGTEDGEAAGVVPSSPATLSPRETSGSCGSVDGSPVLRFFGPFLTGGGTEDGEAAGVVPSNPATLSPRETLVGDCVEGAEGAGLFCEDAADLRFLGPDRTGVSAGVKDDVFCVSRVLGLNPAAS